MIKDGIVYECVQQVVEKKSPDLALRRRLITDELSGHFASLGAFTSDHHELVNFDAFGFAYDRMREKDRMSLLGAKFVLDGDKNWCWQALTINDRAEVLNYIQSMSDALLHFYHDLAFAGDFVACYVDSLKQAEADAAKRMRGLM